jgi:hypothetical protein
MSLSNKEREGNIVLAIRLMMQDLGEPYEWQEHDAATEKFADVHRTTWDELVERGLVKASTFDRYSLTGDGWIAGLKVIGQFDDPNFREKAGKLCRALKARVKDGREWGCADRTELASETGLSEFFIYDAIDSHLLREMSNRTDATWSPDDQMKNSIDIPPRFGLPLL